MKCNYGIGLLGDDAELLERAVVYLRTAPTDGLDYEQGRLDRQRAHKQARAHLWPSHTAEKRRGQRRNRPTYKPTGRPRGGGPLINGAYQRAKTECPQGHLYDEVNTRIERDGSRSCRICERRQGVEAYWRRKERCQSAPR